MGRPGVFGSLDEDLAELNGQGIGAVVSLTHEELNPDALRKARLESLHLPISDFSSPTSNQIDRFVDFVDRMNDQGVGVVVHCGTGSGRTGTILACYLVSKGHSAEDAIKEVRRNRDQRTGGRRAALRRAPRPEEKHLGMRVRPRLLQLQIFQPFRSRSFEPLPEHDQRPVPKYPFPRRAV